MNTLAASLWLLVFALPNSQNSSGPLIHWKLDEGRGTVAHDTSGHGLSGNVGAAWVTHQSGYGLHLDGTPSSVVSTAIPVESRVGKGSWTLSAWIRPELFDIDSNQNQRRLFYYGRYPIASFNVDITGAGNISVFQCYQFEGKDHAAGAESSARLALHKWAYVAVVCDRRALATRIYINGILRADQPLPTDFQPDYNISGDFTLGNGWHNYCGLADEVKLYNRALAPSEIKQEFGHWKDVFEVVRTPEEATADAVEATQAALIAVNRSWAKGDFTAVKKTLLGILGRRETPASILSYTHLRLAQSYAAAGKPELARKEFVKIAADAVYPDVHRMEAKESVGELDRVAKGLPARDVAASRAALAALPPVQRHIYVSPTGTDSNLGTKQRPLASLAAARDRVRAVLRSHGKGTIEIDFAPGRYRLSDTVKFSEQDSGSPMTPVLYRSEKPGTATFYGGIPVSGFKPVTDPAVSARLPAESRGKVVQVDLKAKGITDYGSLAVRGCGQAPSPPTLELYVDGKPQTLARWPNEGYVFPKKLVDPGNSTTGAPSVLGYDADRPARWMKAEDPWLFGYFQFLWADATAKIAKIDPVAKTLTTAAPYHYDGTGMTMEQGIKYYVFNLLEEIDMPGEWYLNRNTGILYLYPPSDLSKSAVEISMLSMPMITADRLSHVRFEGLTLDLGRDDAVALTDCHDCELVGCTVRRFAGNGVCVHGGSRVSLVSCDIYNIGRRATEVIGGDRQTLTPGGHLVANCSIHDCGRIDRTYTPCIQLEGVGNRVLHNVMFNCPSSAMRIEGNDHLVEYNEFHHVVQESDDQGAVDIFRNPTYRGLVFKHNYFHDLGSGTRQKLVVGQSGIRLDDAISGVLIYGNVFDRVGTGYFGGVQMNSGRDNIIDNNLFCNSDKGISGGYYTGNGSWTEARTHMPADFITSPLYLKRYPALAWMLKDPGMNYVWGNLFCRIGRDETGDRNGLELVGNIDIASQVADPSSARLNQFGFRPIPFGEIGLYRDAWRSNVTRLAPP